jgi:predicted negative regulator of RcsB-dependent stress response
MNEEITIINSTTRNERIINFFKNNKKKLIKIFIVIAILIIGYFSYGEIKKNRKIKLANDFNLAVIDFDFKKKDKTVRELTEIIRKKDNTYSPLALFFLIDNNLIENNNTINDLFDVLINQTKLEKEIKNLMMYKKALFNANFADENQLIKILNPIINSESIWKSHSLYLMAEYFFAKGEKKKAKEFFNQILILTNSNNDIKIDSQKRLNRDLGE